MRKQFLLYVFVFAVSFASAQVGINDNGNLPDPSAMLDVSSADKGFLVPRLSVLQRDAISEPATGLQVFNLTDGCLQVYYNSEWSNIWCYDCSVSITAQPEDYAGCQGEDALFEVEGTGYVQMYYQWETRSPAGSWTEIPGEDTTQLIVSAFQISDDSTQYRCRVVVACGIPVYSDTAQLIVDKTVASVTVQPVDQNIDPGDNVVFALGASDALVYQWQESTDGGFFWSDLSDGGLYSGVTTDSLKINTVPGSMDGNRYRCKTGHCSIDDTTGSAALHMCPLVMQDYDGNIYPTVHLGEQCWMADNLKVEHYRNGNAIGTDFSGTAGAYAYYDNDEATYKDTYGALYNWYAGVDSRALCPEGWHIPSDDEWKTLEIVLGMTEGQAGSSGFRGTDQGARLAGNAALWTNGLLENDAAFGSAGFNALPGGILDNSLFVEIYDKALFLSSDVSGAQARIRILQYDEPGGV